jgi:hypothetical protein
LIIISERTSGKGENGKEGRQRISGRKEERRGGKGKQGRGKARGSGEKNLLFPNNAKTVSPSNMFSVAKEKSLYLKICKNCKNLKNFRRIQKSQNPIKSFTYFS